MRSRVAERARRMIVGVVCSTLALVAAACLNDPISNARVISLSLSANPTTAAVGQDIEFTYVATGSGLSRLILAYGDGSADTTGILGQLEASGRLTHAYQSAGTFTIEGEATGFAGTATQSLTVTVN